MGWGEARVHNKNKKGGDTSMMGVLGFDFYRVVALIKFLMDN